MRSTPRTPERSGAKPRVTAFHALALIEEDGAIIQQTKGLLSIIPCASCGDRSTETGLETG